MGKTLSIAPKGGAKKVHKKRSPWREYGLALVVAVGSALLIKIFLIQAFRTPSRSMEDSLLVGDFLLVDKFTYGAPLPFISLRLPALAHPRIGDIVVFKYPLDPERVYIKRCIATEGQVVEVRNKVVYVDGSRAQDPPYSKYEDARIFSSSQNPRDNFGPQRIPEDYLFVMGDNRDNSRDSRHWGLLPRDLVIGKALCIYWSCEPGVSPGLLVDQVASLPQRIRWKRLGDWVQ
jgi:signal peptidase I